MTLETTILLLVQSIREGNYDLYIDCVLQLLYWFFALLKVGLRASERLA